MPMSDGICRNTAGLPSPMARSAICCAGAERPARHVMANLLLRRPSMRIGYRARHAMMMTRCHHDTRQLYLHRPAFFQLRRH